MAYYHDIVTQKSWEELSQLSKKIKFILIGGWAVYFYTKALKSKDIDILVEFPELGKLKKFYDVAKNERLKKYEARREGIQIDVYLPHYSFLGIPAEDLMDKTSFLEGFTLLKKEYLFVLKLYVFARRARSVKGEKDFLDILALFESGIDTEAVVETIKMYKLQKSLRLFLDGLAERNEVLELNINRHLYKKLKNKIFAELKPLNTLYPLNGA
jgi:predicted nucleotidyltransferase